MAEWNLDKEHLAKVNIACLEFQDMKDIVNSSIKYRKVLDLLLQQF